MEKLRIKIRDGLMNSLAGMDDCPDEIRPRTISRTYGVNCARHGHEFHPDGIKGKIGFHWTGWVKMNGWNQEF